MAAGGQTRWNELYPRMQDGDVEYRANIFRWIDHKLPSLIGLMPIITAHLGNDELSLGDWRAANRPDEQGHRDDQHQTLFPAALAAMPSHHLIEQTSNLSAAGEELKRLNTYLDGLCGKETPDSLVLPAY